MVTFAKLRYTDNVGRSDNERGGGPDLVGGPELAPDDAERGAREVARRMLTTGKKVPISRKRAISPRESKGGPTGEICQNSERGDSPQIQHMVGSACLYRNESGLARSQWRGYDFGCLLLPSGSLILRLGTSQ